MVPVMLGLGLINVNAVIGTIFASKLIDPTLAPSAIDKAFRVYMLPRDVLGRDRDVLYPSSPGSRPAATWRLPRHGLDRPAPDQLPARSGGRRLGRSGGADRASPLRARRVHPRPDDGGRGCARRLLARAHLQRDDADAEPRLLRPAGAVDADARRPRPRRPHHRARRSSTASAPGESRSRSRWRTSSASCSCSRRCAGAWDVST